MIYVSPNLEPGEAEELSRKMGVKLVTYFGRYLGTPIVQGRVKKETYKDVVSKMNKRMALWNPHKISMAGRLTLCQSVLGITERYMRGY